MVETEANDHAIELHVTEDIDTNDFVEATRESEKINDVDVNIESDDNEVNDESILGKVFDTAEDAYDFYNDYSFLHGFVQYDKAVVSRRAAEEDEDFKTMNSRPVLSSVHPIEAKAVSITCSCAKYETHGILCKHSLYVMKKRHVQTLPNHYILPRWTLNARYKVSNVSIGLGDMNTENEVSTFTLWCVRSNFNKLIEQARDSPSEIQKLNTLLISLLKDQVVRKKSISFENASQGSCMGISQVDMMPQLSIRDPLGPTTTKGRPKVASRKKSPLEAPKKRTCSYCQGLGHYASSCSKRKADESIHEKEK
ncbi:unnamed protein product [Lactuca saligna]|uniref:SWIM-type domain-containing protein n=1 Tax=Lactuca saligna TaxID=75948 RepID=A0AA35ZU12_LACSI|nr:unnamed protein product [Lactuca saligna]